jgi:hypothetical protein
MTSCDWPRTPFAGLTRQSPWDEFQGAYFAGEANWNCFTAPTEYREFDGTMVPTRRRVDVRNPDGYPVRDSLSIAIDFTDGTFS